MGQSVAKPETQLRALKASARKVLKADEHHGKMLGVGTNAQVRDAQREVWVAMSELRKVVKRYAR